MAEGRLGGAGMGAAISESTGVKAALLFDAQETMEMVVRHRLGDVLGWRGLLVPLCWGWP